ncbi:MAG: hypothetical protein SV487_09540 [Thermodesulfobacteriota bacterium]|nr:hypothetical protein [Thermodesulfobacteriota bacterium]
MKEVTDNTSALCRHLKYGRCTNHFWKVMQKDGKPGLVKYYCLLWQNKLQVLNKYHEAVRRARRLGLSEPECKKVAARALARYTSKEVTCPDFRLDPDSPSGRCRYFYLECCLIKFPRCPGTCDDFLPLGDQRSRPTA